MGDYIVTVITNNLCKTKTQGLDRLTEPLTNLMTNFVIGGNWDHGAPCTDVVDSSRVIERACQESVASGCVGLTKSKTKRSMHGVCGWVKLRILRLIQK